MAAIELGSWWAAHLCRVGRVANNVTWGAPWLEHTAMTVQLPKAYNGSSIIRQSWHFQSLPELQRHGTSWSWQDSCSFLQTCNCITL